MKENPLVSILVTNYNNADYIVESLDSAIGQTYTNIEIVVVDDKSTDDSVAVVRNYIDQHPDFRFTLYVSPKNAGCPASKRKSVELSCGDYFLFLDSDDKMSEDAVETLLAVMLGEKRYSIVYSSQYLCNEKLVPLGRSLHCGPIPEGKSNLTSKTGHVSYLTLCSRECYDQTLGFDVNAGLAEDQDFYFKMEEVAPVCYIDLPLYYYRKHDHNISYNASSTVRNQYWLLKAKTEAYHRRKRSHSKVPNLTYRELLAIRLDYHITNASFCRAEKKPWLSEFLKVLLYTPISVRKGLRGIKTICSRKKVE